MATVLNGLAGAVTIAAPVGLRILCCPCLLRRRGGRGRLALATAAPGAFIYGFDQPGDRPVLCLLPAAPQAIAPANTALIVHRLQAPPADHRC